MRQRPRDFPDPDDRPDELRVEQRRCLAMLSDRELAMWDGIDLLNPAQRARRVDLVESAAPIIPPECINPQYKRPPVNTPQSVRADWERKEWKQRYVTQEDVRTIRRHRLEGKTPTEIAVIMDLRPGHVSHICRGVIWKHVA